MAPMGSIWLIGFSVSLPAFLAVGSPRESAAFPCAYSWIAMAKRMTNTLIRMPGKSVKFIGMGKVYIKFGITARIFIGSARIGRISNEDCL